MQEKQLQLVNYEQAKKLKELGFDWRARPHYIAGRLYTRDFTNSGDSNHNLWDNAFSAPTVALALKWFRDVKGLCGSVSYDHTFDNDSSTTWNHYVYIIHKKGQDYAYYAWDLISPKDLDKVCRFNTYEEAESAL